MKISIKNDYILLNQASMVAVPIIAEQKNAIDEYFDKPVDTLKSLMKLIKKEIVSGKKGDDKIINYFDTTYKKISLIGIGRKPLSGQTGRYYSAQAVQLASKEKIDKLAIVLGGIDDDNVEDALTAVVEGVKLASYRFSKYSINHKKNDCSLKEVVILVDKKINKKISQQSLRKGLLMAQATIFARDLVNEPASEMTPGNIVKATRQMCRQTGIKLKVYNEQQLKTLGARAVLAVAKGSDEQPYLVHLTYKPKKKAKAKVVVVGKGLTFDSGGLSLKPSEGMEDMKIDMAGSAAMLGVMSVLSTLAPQIEVHGIAAFCENMPSGRAMRPGDIVTAMSGKTIEILNTDAEGRVTLADTLYYGSKLKPDYMIDLATLTGACMVALGSDIAGLMTNSTELAKIIKKSAKRAGELMWRLPLPSQYEKLIKGNVGDVKNIASSRYGGAITAGLFLRQFVGDVNWAHLDIAGPSYAEKTSVPYQPIGGTGFGARTVLQFILDLHNSR